jgi:putative nucleotidyltransferase with HDIG domain
MSTKNYSILTKKYKSLLSGLHSIYRLIHASYELTDLAGKLTKLLSQIFKCDACSFTLLTKRNDHNRNEHRIVILKATLSGNKRLVTTQRCAVKSKLDQRIIATSAAIKSDRTLGVPLITDDVIGTIIITRTRATCRKEGGFDLYDLEALMTIASLLVLAVRNIELVRDQEKIVMGTIKSLVAVLDSKMPPAYTHTPYFSRLVTALAEEMRMRKEEIDSLKYASMLHDAGKVNIPTEILTKSTQLTGEEYDIIKRHPVKGAEIIKHVDILKPVIPIILHHHEKYDGTGYPSRLKKGKIPIGARVMSVADAFDAMVYGRPYRERINPLDALEEIKKHSGTQFDPWIVRSLVKIFHNKKLKKYLNLTC